MNIDESDIALHGSGEATTCFNNYTTTKTWCAANNVGRDNCSVYNLHMNSGGPSSGEEYVLVYCATDSANIINTPSNINCSAGEIGSWYRSSAGVYEGNKW